MTDKPESFPLPTHRPELVDFLATRRSNLAKVMEEPGPDNMTRDKIIEMAARVPDHRKLTPWRFIVFEGRSRSAFGEPIANAFQAQTENAPADRIEFERTRLMRAPLVVAVISSPVSCPRGTPKWEQEMSAGAVCFNMCLAAQAHGFGAQWLTEWYAYDETVLKALGLSASERVAGFIYIGTPSAQAAPRARPNLMKITSYWAD